MYRLLSCDNSLKILFLVYLISCPYVFYNSFARDNSDTIRGYAKRRFKRVEEVFRYNFAAEYEREGASLSIYHRGEQIVNLWGGYADRNEGRRWNPKTITPLFSITKAIASVVIAVLVDRGLLHYEDKVTKYWSEYGTNGKENTTIEDVLTHSAGVPYLVGEQISLDDIRSGKIIAKVANVTPIWEPGTASGYHPVTFGLILDGIVMSVDPKRRNVAQFLKDEIADAHGIDVHIGVNEENRKRITKVTSAGFWEYIRDVARDPRLLVLIGVFHARFDDIANKLTWNTPWLRVDWDQVTLNDPSIISLPLAAVTGATSAAEIARLFSYMLSGKLISNHTLSKIVKPTLTSWHVEQVVLWPINKGHGFFYEPHPFIQGAYTFGHPGFGGQYIYVDPWTDTVIAYLSNGLKTGSGILCTPFMNILNEVYSIFSLRKS